MSADWRLKIAAFLHDPPDKVFNLEGHQGRALTHIERVIGSAAFADLFGKPASELQTRKAQKAHLDSHPEWTRVKKADAVASAMDRAAFPSEMKFPWSPSTKPVVRHPLSGREAGLPSLADPNASRGIDDVIQETLDLTPDGDLKNRYLMLWRRMQDMLCEHDASSLKGSWRLLPADTRIVDHSLWDHANATAALVSALPQPALLVFGLGPVQEFIATARRTQDLWMGSYILSYLAWRGMKMIADGLGPDAVLYPSLRGQPLVDEWLRTEQGLPGGLQPTPEDLSRATLPNKFVAILPGPDAEAFARRIEQAIQDGWKEMVESVGNWLRKEVAFDPSEDLWQAHQRQFPDVYWSVHRWADVAQFEASRDEADAALDEYRQLLELPPDGEFSRIYTVFSKTAPRMVNVGTVYSRLHELAQHGFEARKATRGFAAVEEQGAKCTLCGQRSALHDGRRSAKEFWCDVSVQLRNRPDLGLFVAVRPDGRERLCGLCTAKRFAHRAYFFEEKGVPGGFPSTSSVAAASFKARVIQGLADPSLSQKKRERLVNALADHMRALERLKLHPLKHTVTRTLPLKDTAAQVLPRLAALRDELPATLMELATDLIRYDGEAFYVETFTIERLRSDYGLPHVTEDQLSAARSTLRRLLKVCRDECEIAPPAKYFAIVKLDGDRIRDWLRGEHNKTPCFSDALHPEFVADLRDPNWQGWQQIAGKRQAAGEQISAHEMSKEWQEFLNGKRFLSPALHAALSRALANFALRLSPSIVEQQHCGRIVYAGGDDLLALLPVDEVLPAARRLRAVFSGEARLDDRQGVHAKFNDPSLNGLVELNGEQLLTMGPLASASFGICIAHHLSPLDTALNAARQAEKTAKAATAAHPTRGESGYDRNAVCITFLRRSGEEKRIGAQWSYPGQLDDTVGLLFEIQEAFARSRLSMKFAHAVAAEARILAGSIQAAIPLEAQSAALRRLLERHRGASITPDEGELQARLLAPQLARLAEALHQHCPGDDASPDKPQPGMVQLADWLLLLRFLAQGGTD